MPAVPYYPSEEPDEQPRPDIDRIIDRIIGNAMMPSGRSTADRPSAT